MEILILAFLFICSLFLTGPMMIILVVSIVLSYMYPFYMLAGLTLYAILMFLFKW